jgi:coenzyme F420-reducing hydrogenase delta subunit
MRLQYPSNLKIIRLPCTGKVDLVHILKAFEKGVDGLYVVGCLEGECHYKNGNLRARKRIEQAREILERIGIGGERVQMYNLSSSEAPRFVQAAEHFTEPVRALGPNPLKESKKKMAA